MEPKPKVKTDPKLVARVARTLAAAGERRSFLTSLARRLRREQRPGVGLVDAKGTHDVGLLARYSERLIRGPARGIERFAARTLILVRKRYPNETLQDSKPIGDTSRHS
jgi:hypothetical protein